jgi:hypothetical protein
LKLLEGLSGFVPIYVDEDGLDVLRDRVQVFTADGLGCPDPVQFFNWRQDLILEEVYGDRQDGWRLLPFEEGLDLVEVSLVAAWRRLYFLRGWRWPSE